MNYKITFRERASKEYLNSLAWYKRRSFDAAENFIKAIEDALEKIASDPMRYRNTYKKFHEAGVKKFPFSIVYFIDEDEHCIIITSIFHYKRNPSKKFKDND
jgi:plasmid stabilization system protein ParE